MHIFSKQLIHYIYNPLSPEPPNIIEKPESQSVIPGTRVKFSVLISGTPPFTIKWFKDKKEVLTGADCSVQKDDSSSSVELFFTKPSHSGEYICEISNDVGSDSCQTTLFVKGFYFIFNLTNFVCLITDLLVLF